MVLLSNNNIQSLARLARIKITEGKIDKLQKDLASILDYIEQLKEVEGNVNEEMMMDRKIDNIFRDDEECNELEGSSDKLIDMAPSTKGRYVKAKRVL